MITYADSGGFGSLPFNGAGGTFAFGSACASNDLIIAYVQLLNASNNVAVTITDNVNSGAYIRISSNYFDAPHAILTAFYYKVCNASGTPTLSTGSVAAVSSNAGGTLGALRFNGFNGTPVLDSPMVQRTTGTTNTVASASLSTTSNPELIVALESGTENFNTGPGPGGGWTQDATANNQGVWPWYQIVSSAVPTASQFTDVAASGFATGWQALTAGFGVVGNVLAWTKA